ncbi:Hypothetical protein FKW44_004090 [Caligus rogercresseyi]|uniref:Uncharacterized protein n=1 Tax=Caligus rogercresseyi TaxID=217165 RepID=A0A7T8KAZ5_CALRO|nr:Hypothetical protein FKW44_004090 [Caligus rogercresseyi]
MLLQMCRFCLFNTSTFYVDDALNPGAEEEQALATRALSNFLACFIKELIRAALVL